MLRLFDWAKDDVESDTEGIVAVFRPEGKARARYSAFAHQSREWPWEFLFRRLA